MKRTRKEWVPPKLETVPASNLRVGDIIWNDRRESFDHILKIQTEVQTEKAGSVTVDLSYTTLILQPKKIIERILTRGYYKVIRIH